MKQLKCENCGAKIEIKDENAEYGTCPYCKAKYQLHETKDINIKMDDNTKEILSNSFGNFNKQSKFATAFIMTIAAVMIIAIMSTFVINTNIFKSKDTSNNDDTINKINEKVENTKKEINKSSFNGKFEIRSGTDYKSTIEYILDDVVTNNKTNKDMLITVKYKDKETTDPDTIIEIKHSLNDRNKYEVKLDYDNDGYVNKITLEDI